MAINFPNSPLAGQVYEYGDYKYTYDGVKWTSVIKYSSDSVKAHSSLAEIVADTKIKNGDWVKDLSTQAEYVSGTVGDIPLANGLFITELGLSDLKKAEVVAKTYGVAEDNVTILRIGEITGANYLYDPVTEFTYHSSPVLTGYLSDVGTDAAGVRTIVVEGSNYIVTRSMPSKTLRSVADLQGLVGVEGQQVSVASYHGLGDLSGGGVFVWSTGRHNGGTSIDPNRAFPEDWNDQAQLEAWFADSGSDVGGWERVENNHITVEMYGAFPTLNLSPFVVQASKNNSVVNLDGDTTYKLDTLAVISANTIVNFNDAQINVNSTNYGFVMGDSADVLNYRIKLLNLNLVLTNKTVTAVWSRANVKCEATGYIEGPIFGTAEDATRTNVGLFVDGANISSFGNRWSIQCNHIHEGFRIGTSGTLHPTAQLFDDCYTLGDQATDSTSIGYNFADNGSVTQIGQGTVIRGGNVELVNTGFYIGANTGSITVIGTRMEVNQSATSWKIDFANGCDPCSFTEIQGLGVDFIDTNSGVRNIASNTHTVSGLDFNDTRIGGYAGRHPAQQLIGYGGSTFAHYFDPNSATYFLQSSDSAGTGEMVMQAGGGSASFGGSISMFAASNAAYGGEVHVAPTPSSAFKVKNGLYGSNRMVVTSSEITAGADNASSSGSAAIRYAQVFAVTGTVNTSDEREKTKILTIDETLKAVALEIKSKIGIYQWLSSVEQKGADNARWHFGVGAQTVRDIFESHGLDGFKYGCLCYDEWEETPEVTSEVPVFNNDVQVFDENGEPVYETVISEVYRPASNRFGVRVDQLLMLMLSAL